MVIDGENLTNLPSFPHKLWDTLIKLMSISKGLWGPRFRGSKSSKLAAARLGCELAQLHVSLQQWRVYALYFTHHFLEEPSSADSSSWHSFLPAWISVEAFCLVGSWIRIMQCLRSKEIIKYNLQIYPMSSRALFQTRLMPYRVDGARWWSYCVSESKGKQAAEL